MYKKIVLAYDGSSFSAAALRQGGDLAELCGAELHMVAVVVTTGVWAIAEGTGGVDAWGMQEKELLQSLDGAAHEVAKKGVNVVIAVRRGDPGQEIIAYVNEIRADIVVIGHSEEGLLTGWLRTSVGEAVLDQMPCSLLVATGNG